MRRLPCPRFEFRWSKIGETWEHRECVYSLVFPLREHDIRREDEDGNEVRDEWTCEIGRTKVTGGRGNPPIGSDGEIDVPFRDGAHVWWDGDALGLGRLPIIAVCGDQWSDVDDKRLIER